MQSDSPIEVAIAADDAFALPMTVTMKSALLAAGPSTRFRLHVLDGGLSAESRRRIERSWRDPRLEVRWCTPDFGVLSGLPVSGHVNAMTYARLLLQHYVPEDVERVLYLDSDLLVLADLSALWAMPWEDVACLATPDVGAPWVNARQLGPDGSRCIRHLADTCPIANYEQLGFAPSDPYLNGGVLLANLDAWRDMDFCARALRCLDEHRASVTYWDQYALNVVLRGRWRAIDMAWNQGFMAIAYRTWRRSPFDRATYERLRYRPNIVHFTTGNKPWKLDGLHPFRRRFFEIVDQTDWAGWRPGPGVARARAVAARVWRSCLKRASNALSRGAASAVSAG